MLYHYIIFQVYTYTPTIQDTLWKWMMGCTEWFEKRKISTVKKETIIEKVVASNENKF